jgi:hypothetical protein
MNAGDVMTRHVISISPDAPIWETGERRLQLIEARLWWLRRLVLKREA